MRCRFCPAASFVTTETQQYTGRRMAPVFPMSDAGFHHPKALAQSSVTDDDVRRRNPRLLDPTPYLAEGSGACGARRRPAGKTGFGQRVGLCLRRGQHRFRPVSQMDHAGSRRLGKGSVVSMGAKPPWAGPSSKPRLHASASITTSLLAEIFTYMDALLQPGHDD